MEIGELSHECVFERDVSLNDFENVIERIFFRTEFYERKLFLTILKVNRKGQ